MTDDCHATLWNILPALLLAGLVLLQGGGLDKPLALAAAAVFLLTALSKRATADLSRRLSPTALAVGGYFLLSMAAGLYAKWGWLAVGEAAKYLTAFCVFGTLILRLKEGGVDRLGTAVAAVCAFVALLSVDASSAELFSRPVLALVDALGGEYGLMSTGYEQGIRITGIFGNPNALAGLLAFGIFLSLSLLQTARTARERLGAALLTMCNAFGFLLAFSMGGIAAFALALAAYLLLTDKERRLSLLVTLAEVGGLALLLAFTAMPFLGRTGVGGLWPVLAGPAGGLLLWALQSKFQPSGRSKAVSAGVAALIAAAIGYILLGYHLTGGITLAPGQTLRRSAYPEGGAYQVNAQWDGAPVVLTVESQNTQQAIMHTSTVLYQGPLDQAVFTVPGDSRVVYFDLTAPEGAELEKLTLSDGRKVPLGYKLFPAFVANRIQGLWANQNAIQRTVFFADGMKLFRRSPVIGLGIGAFENAILGVQSFFYETKYAHNHYVETLVTTGAVGLGLFLLMLGAMALALLKNLRRKEGAHPLAPALLAALVFMAAHAGVEIVFSFCFYLPMALGVFGLICLCVGPELPLPGGEKAGTGLAAATCVLLSVFAVLLYLNMSMARMISDRDYRDPFQALDKAARLDRFEWTTYTLSYVYAVKDMEASDPGSTDPAVLARADEHALRLAQVDSNTIPRHLAEYYFVTGRPEQAVEMLEKYIDYTAADSRTWQQAFSILQAYWSVDLDLTRAETAKLYGELQTWNEEHMGTLTLSQENLDFIRVMAVE